MRALDVVVHASVEPEPFGRVVAEAMACGRAVVASDAGGVREIAKDGENALLHPCGDAAALAERIERLADPSVYARDWGPRAGLTPSFVSDAHEWLPS